MSLWAGRILLLLPLVLPHPGGGEAVNHTAQAEPHLRGQQPLPPMGQHDLTASQENLSRPLLPPILLQTSTSFLPEDTFRSHIAPEEENSHTNISPLTGSRLLTAGSRVLPPILGEVISHQSNSDSSSSSSSSGSSTLYLSSPPAPSCTRPSSCTPPATSSLTCFGTELGYTQTSFALSGLQKFWQIEQSLKQWEGLRQVPACWKVVQPLLCGLYLPKCENSSVQLVPTDLCKVVQSPCRIVAQINPDWAKLLQCDAPHFSECKNDERSERLRFDSNTTCLHPLVMTHQAESFFPDIDQCGMKCESPLLTSEEYTRLNTFIGIAGCVCLTCTLFASATFLVDWAGAGKYPALAIFYINVCFFLATLGWLAQLGTKEDIVCRKDGTLRQNEPGSGENLSCVVVFVLVYYFTTAGGVWLVILTYTWAAFFTNSGKVKDLIEPKTAYFHMVAWFLPLVLSIIILAINRVDASSVYGICYVGFENIYTRVLFLLLPFFFFLLVSAYFSVRSMVFLARVSCNMGFLSEKESSKVQATLLRMGFFCVLTLVLVLVVFSCHVYDFLKAPDWEQSIRELILCRLRREVFADSSHETCSNKDRPSLTVIELQVLCMFGAGILSSSWVWTRETLTTWRLFLTQLVTREKSQRPVRLKKHQLIAQAFAKRCELQANGRLSLTFQSVHEDPLGMNVDLDAESSGEFSSGWAAALPHLVQRRGALCGAEQLGLRRNSIDSMNSMASISQTASIRSTARFSWIESRKQSMSGASQSLHQSDIDRLQSLYDESLKKSRKRSKRNFFKAHVNRIRPWSRQSSRRGSSVSRNSDTSLNSQILPAITLDPARLVAPPHSHRSKTQKGGRRGDRPDWPITVPEPGRSTDFGGGRNPPSGIPTLPTDPSYRELEEKLRQLASVTRTSREDSIGMSGDTGPQPPEAVGCGSCHQEQPRSTQQSSHLVSTSVQTSLTDLTGLASWKQTTSTGTQMSPSSAPRPPPTSPATTTTTSQGTPAATTTTTTTETSSDLNTFPLRHIEANVVSIKIGGPSSEDSSIPSSYEKDFRLKKLVPGGKENLNLIPLGENLEHEVHLNMMSNSIEIPSLKSLTSTGPLIRPRDHHRGRRGAIVEKLSPTGKTKKTAGSITTDS